MDAWTHTLLIEALELCLAGSAACLLVLPLRQPVRRLFGAGAAYLLWALLPVCTLAVLLPAPESSPALIALQANGSVILAPLPTIATAEADLAGPASALLRGLWALGGALALARLWQQQQRRFRQRLGTIERRDDGRWQAQSCEGLPALLGLRARIAPPLDFEQRYPPEQQALALAHERVHAARGDVLWNTLFAAFSALHWFNPLLHFAQRVFRADQELACDERVLSLHPHSRRLYGTALLNSPTSRVSAPLACPAFGTHPLKERITLLSQPLPTAGRRLAGAVLAPLSDRVRGRPGLGPAGSKRSRRSQPHRQH
jgi:beta-lactamase regulating signal transducer with metallopeptidase domain